MLWIKNSWRHKLAVEYEQGYLIVSVNNSTTDYVNCARVLAYSIRAHEPDAKICLLSDRSIVDPVFDIVKNLPYGNTSRLNWQLDLDWQVFFASPFRETIKLEADMLISSPIKHWFSAMRHLPVCLTSGCYNYHGHRSTTRAYRRVFDDNHLLDVYNAVTYWRLSNEARDFFLTVKHIFQHWPIYMSAIKGGANQLPNTDLAYAIAVELLGKNSFHIPGATYPQIVHMKPAIAQTSGRWDHELTWEIDQAQIRINGFAQVGAVHYHEKSLAQDFTPYYV